MPTKQELQNISEKRFEEAKELYNKGLFDGAAYLSGYVVEIALKARICKLLNVSEYPENGRVGHAYKTHVIDDLVLLAGLKEELNNRLNSGSDVDF